MGILSRLYNITKSNTLGYVESLGKVVGLKGNRMDAETTTGDKGSFGDFSDNHTGGRNRTYSGNPGDTNHAGIPQQIIEDLAVFDLKPPSSMDEVRKARNREIKKYHSDKFINDPERLNVSTEIMQIYNTAYDRLKEHYENK